MQTTMVMMSESKTLTQVAPYPEILEELVANCKYRPGWEVELQDIQRDEDHGRGEGRGLTLVITTLTTNSYAEDKRCDTCWSPITRYRVHHYFIVPAATYDKRAWQRWLFEQFLKVEQHEAMEFFAIDGERPFSPIHAPGADPYTVTELSTDTERRTSYRGELND